MTLVYSTDSGRMCPDCRKPMAQCQCKASKRPEGDGIVRISREKRSGKTVSVVKGLPLEAEALAVFAKQLKAACGSGGTVKDWVVEIQGDHVDKLMAAVAAAGHKVKRAGG
ncbi:translation initiation factor Sui1 [Pelomonas sp. KK5]|uniref:translation initiation factor Sui1 n=1 Tax=Pelomonas sp. KK5 TaxID=1855730 RepID=UPI00097C960C|nr:translation initiation factor Sui1 [Pelomonas sp. KK5]